MSPPQSPGQLSALANFPPSFNHPLSPRDRAPYDRSFQNPLIFTVPQ